MTRVRGIFLQLGDRWFVKLLSPTEALEAGALVPWPYGPPEKPSREESFDLHGTVIIPRDPKLMEKDPPGGAHLPNFPTPSDGPLKPLAWQAEALIKWEQARWKGIIEAVTGSGKTFLALEAWQRLKKPGLYTLIVVPSVVLQEQWCERIRRYFPDTRVARLGGGHHDSFAKGSILVAVINSAVSAGSKADESLLLKLFDHVRHDHDARTFLIADECHHYIDAPVFSRIRTLITYSYVLALSATVGEQYFVEGFGEIVFSYTFGDAVRDGVVPRFKLFNTPCNLFKDERRTYEDLTEKIEKQIELVRKLFREHLSEEAEERFFQVLKSLDIQAGPNGQSHIRRLFGLLFKRSSLVYRAKHKMQTAQDVILALVNDLEKKVIVFFERIDSAEETHERFDFETAKSVESGIRARIRGWSGILHSGLNKQERQDALLHFATVGPAVLFTCRALDEGWDIPDLDAAILVASTKSARQRTQRIGRVLRRGCGVKQPVVVTLYCENTGDVGVVARDQELFSDAADIISITPSMLLKELRRQ